MEQVEEALRDVPLLRLVIHGDYGLHNLLFDKRGTVTPIDFELARIEWRLRDIFSALARYSKGAYDFESMQCFLRAYQAEYPLTAIEWQFMPQVWRLYKLQDAVKYWNGYFETDRSTRRLLRARAAAGQVDWALNHQDKLAELRSSCSRVLQSAGDNPDAGGKRVSFHLPAQDSQYPLD
jgi:Ser/Thr protein kinase RdoA (MazF antagonist)